MTIWRVRPHADPVFVDRSGRRRGLATLIGVGLGTALLVSLGLIVAGLQGASPVPLPGFPGGGQYAEQGPDGNAGAGAPSPSPGTSRRPSPGTSVAPPASTATASPATATNSAGHVAGPPSDRGRPSKTG
jgi:hypothetical protein